MNNEDMSEMIQKLSSMINNSNSDDPISNLDNQDISQFIPKIDNDYLYKNIAYKTCDLFFEASIPAGAGTIFELLKKLHGQESEVSGFVAKKINSKEDIENLPLAFASAKKALNFWLLNR